MFWTIKTDRGKKRLDASGPAPSNIRKIPFFEMPTGPGPAITINDEQREWESWMRVVIDLLCVYIVIDARSLLLKLYKYTNAHCINIIPSFRLITWLTSLLSKSVATPWRILDSSELCHLRVWDHRLTGKVWVFLLLLIYAYLLFLNAHSS